MKNVLTSLSRVFFAIAFCAALSACASSAQSEFPSYSGVSASGTVSPTLSIMDY